MIDNCEWALLLGKENPDIMLKWLRESRMVDE